MGNIRGPVVIKVVAVVVLLIATVVGCQAHFKVRDYMNMIDDFVAFCKAEPTCPYSAFIMEIIFVAFTISCLILSTLNIVASFVIDASKIKRLDTGYHALAGLLLLIAGILMIVAAIQIDNFVMDNLALMPFSKSEAAFMTKIAAAQKNSVIQTKVRKELKFSNKLAGGALALLDGLLCFIAAGIIHKSS